MEFYEYYRSSEFQSKCIMKKHCDNTCGAEFCKRCYSVNYYIFYSLIPKNYLKGKKLKPYDIDLEAFKKLNNIKENIDLYVEDGQNLMLRSSRCGNGKTSWSVKLLLNYFLKVSKFGILNDGLFLNMSNFIFEIKDSISNKNDELPDKMKRAMEADLLVLDDIGVTEYSPFESDIIWRIVDSRTCNNKSTIYTTNGTEETLLKNLGQRLYSRIVTNSDIVEIKGPDRRGEDKWQSH